MAKYFETCEAHGSWACLCPVGPFKDERLKLIEDPRDPLDYVLYRDEILESGHKLSETYKVRFYKGMWFVYCCLLEAKSFSGHFTVKKDEKVVYGELTSGRS
jgi:hypothetical protein